MMIPALQQMMQYKYFPTFMENIRKIGRIELKRYQTKGVKDTVIGVILLLLFFWGGWRGGQILWPQKIEDPSSFIVWNLLVIHTLFQIVVAFLWLPGYLNWFQAFKSHTINRKTSWPWERANWPEVRTKTIWNLLLNEFIIYPTPIFLSAVIGLEIRFDAFPSFWQVFLQTHLVFFMDDILFYWGHRWAHQVPTFYKIHKVHHQYDHLFSLVNQYTHPIEYLTLGLMPSGLVFLILGDSVHCFTFFFFVVHKIIFNGENHCGFSFGWSPMRVLPFVAEPEFHDSHHSLNLGNFAGSFYIWDVLYGTAGPYLDEFLDGQSKEGKVGDEDKSE